MNKNTIRQIAFRTRSLTLITITCVLLGAFSVPAAHAATISVTNLGPDHFAPDDTLPNGLCSLREAITNANDDAATYADCAAGSGDDTISLGTGTYTVTNDLIITGNLEMDGVGSYNVTLDGGNASRMITVQPGANVTISYMGFVHGFTSQAGGAIWNRGTLELFDVLINHNNAGGDGGGIYNDHGTLTLDGTISNNNAGGDGGGIANNGGTLTVNNREVSNNIADGNGAGISNNNILTVNHVWLHDNTSSNGSGGNLYSTNIATINDSLFQKGHSHFHGGNIFSGVAVGSSSLTINRTTISGGEAAENGGGIYNDGALTLTNNTLAGNQANDGTAIYSVEPTQPISLLNTTVVSNTGWLAGLGSGIENTAAAAFTLKNTIVAFNGNAGNCAGTITSLDYNLEFGSNPNTCGLVAANDLDVAPKLGPFQDNGGPNFPYGGAALTYALLPGSPAVNAGTNSGCPATDQRGVTRPHGARCDIGAYETNNAPTASNDAYSTPEDTSLVLAASGGVQANDNDPDGDVVTTTLVLGPAHGTLIVNANGAFSYTPAANYYGTDSFTYTNTDGSESTANTTVSLTITAVNDPPAAGDDSYGTPEDTPLVVVAPGVLSNDSDVESTVLTASLVAGPAHGTLVLNTNGSFTYTSVANYHGPDSFIYRASDGALFSANATVSLMITAVNDPPIASNDTYSTAEDTPLVVAAPGVQANDSDPDGDMLTTILVAGPAHGTLVLNANGAFSYTPAAQYHGVDSFTYANTDGALSTANTTVSLTIAAVNDPPVAGSDTASTEVNIALTMPLTTLLVNDSDIDGDSLTISAVSNPSAHGGSVTLVGSNVIYTPPASIDGADSFTYTLSDGNGGTATGFVTVYVGKQLIYIPLIRR